MSDTTISDVLSSASAQLAWAGVDDPLLNLRVLIGHALQLDPDDVPNHAARVLTKQEIDLIESLVVRREKRETLNRIIGKSEFCDLWFGTNEATLEPRPESQAIV